MHRIKTALVPVPVHLSLSLHLLTGDESEVIPSVGSARGKVCALPTHLCATRDPCRRPRGRPQSLHWGVALQTPGLSRSRCCRSKREADRGCDVCARWLSFPVCLWSRSHSCSVKWKETLRPVRETQYRVASRAETGTVTIACAHMAAAAALTGAVTPQAERAAWQLAASRSCMGQRSLVLGRLQR